MKRALLVLLALSIVGTSAAQQKTAVVDTQTNAFVETGHAPDARYKIVAVPDNPDPRKHRYSGNPASPIRQATAQEIAAYDAAQQDTEATVVSGRFELLVLAIYEHKRRTGAWPTMADKAAIIADLKGAVTRAKALQ